MVLTPGKRANLRLGEHNFKEYVTKSVKQQIQDNANQ